MDGGLGVGDRLLGTTGGVSQQLLEVSGWLTGSGLDGQGLGMMDGVSGWLMGSQGT